MKGVLAPGGWMAKTDPEGKTWELIANGFPQRDTTPPTTATASCSPSMPTWSGT
jgi:hypothetical protein